MNTKPSITNNPSSPRSSGHDARIDAALHVYSRAAPRAEMEAGILASLTAAPRPVFRSVHALRILLVQRLSFAALATAAGWAIVAGTLHHSSLHPNLPQAARTSTSGGASAAGGIHIPTKATPQTQEVDSAAPRTPAHGRATIPSHPGRRSAGAAVPRSPYSASQSPEQHSAEPQQ